MGVTAGPKITVYYAKQENIKLAALIECTLSTEDGKGEMLVGQVVTGAKDEKYLPLEQIRDEAKQVSKARSLSLTGAFRFAARSLRNSL